MLLSTFNKQAKLARMHGYPSYHAAQKTIGDDGQASTSNVLDKRIPSNPTGTPAEIAEQVLAWAKTFEGNPGADYYMNENRYAVTAIVGAMQFLNMPYSNADLARLLSDASALKALLDQIQAKDPEEKGAHVLQLFCQNHMENGEISQKSLRNTHGGLAARLLMSARTPY